MDKLLEEMIDKGLASMENRYILTRIPIWLVTLKPYKPDWIYWLEYLRINLN